MIFLNLNSLILSQDEDNSVTPEFQKLREFIVSNCTLISSYIYITKTAQEIEADTRGVSTEKVNTPIESLPNYYILLIG